MFGHLTPRLPSRIFGLPIAQRKSLAGAFASFGTSFLTTLAFWGFCRSGMGGNIGDPIWHWEQPHTGGWLGISLLSVGAGVAASFTELLGEYCFIAFRSHIHMYYSNNRYSFPR